MFALMICLFQINTINAQAAKHHLVAPKTVLACVNHSWNGYITGADNYKILKAVSSNKDVVKVWEISEDKRYFSWSGMKKGTATLTVKKGYKLVDVRGFLSGQESKVVKNGAKLSLPTVDYYWVVFTIQDTKGRQLEYRVLLQR